jgi:hypothetical protein
MVAANPANREFTCELVIARYKENLQWLSNFSTKKFSKVIVYNKGTAGVECKFNERQCDQLFLANVGRCDHTYLYHIIQNYDNLADVTVFTTGSSDLRRKRKKLGFTVDKVFETHMSVFSVHKLPTPLHVSLKDFKLDVYRSSHPVNFNGVGDKDTLIMKKADPRPFGKWYEKHFSGITLHEVVYAGVFAVSKEHIMNRSKQYYEELIKELEGSSNPEVGHYFERAWLAIFHPIPEQCLYDEVISERQYGGGRRRSRSHARRRTRRLKKQR